LIDSFIHSHIHNESLGRSGAPRGSSFEGGDVLSAASKGGRQAGRARACSLARRKESSFLTSIDLELLRRRDLRRKEEDEIDR